MVTISLYPSEKNTTYKITKNKSSTSNPDLAQSTRLWKRNCGKSLQVQLSLPWLCCLILGQSHSRNLAFLEVFFFFFEWRGTASGPLQHLGGGTREFWETTRRELENSQNLADGKQILENKVKARPDISANLVKRCGISEEGEMSEVAPGKRKTGALIALNDRCESHTPRLCEEKTSQPLCEVCEKWQYSS